MNTTVNGCTVFGARDFAFARVFQYRYVESLAVDTGVVVAN